MAKVITLDGLKSTKLGRRYRKCRRTQIIYSPTIGEDIEVCVGSEPKRSQRRAATKSRSNQEVPKMAKRRKARKSSGGGMRKGSCKIKARRCICRGKNGKVKFAKKGRCKR